MDVSVSAGPPQAHRSSALPAEVFIPLLSAGFTGEIVESGSATKLMRSAGLFELDSAILNGLVGTPVQIRIISGRDVYRIPCAVQGIRQPFLVVTYTSPPELVARRDRQRLACKLPVVYRAVRSTKSFSAWHEATATDINFGGVGLRIEGHVQFPTRIEMQIALPQMGDGEEVCTRLEEAEQDTGGIVRVTGQARHGRFTDEGQTIVGVKFDYLAPASHLRLSGYLEKLAADLVTSVVG